MGWQATGGEGLERQLWQEAKTKRWPELERRLSASWVYLTPAGPLDRTATISRLQQTEISDYQLGDFQTTPNGDVLVVTYTAILKGHVGDRALTDRPRKMMTIWQKTERGWHAIAHSDVHAE